jgi:hypothetical protein
MILKPPRRAPRLITVLSTAWILALPLSSTGQEPKKTLDPVEFDVLYDVGIVPSEKSAHVAIKIGSGSKSVKWITFKIDPLRHRALKADGQLQEVEGGLRWHPPRQGGTLRYILSIDHLRDDNSYDARCAKNWAILRGEDLVPKMRIRTSAGAESVSVLKLRLPEGWSAALPYPSIRGGRYALDDSRTRFDRPSGWFAFGKLGVVRETLDGTEISIAGPAGQGVRRMDTLAMLKWTLPALREVFGKLPGRLQVVIAGDPMWRGGLSGPRSIYLHVDRPLISGDATSPLLHEIVHSLMRARSGDDGKWIVEGIAEYYSLALLRRSETLSANRFEKAIDSIRKRAAPGTTSLESEMTPALRAKSVLVLMEVDRLIRDATAGQRNLDDLVRALVDSDQAITFDHLRATTGEVAGKDFPDFFDRIATSKS